MQRLPLLSITLISSFRRDFKVDLIGIRCHDWLGLAVQFRWPTPLLHVFNQKQWQEISRSAIIYHYSARMFISTACLVNISRTFVAWNLVPSRFCRFSLRVFASRNRNKLRNADIFGWNFPQSDLSSCLRWSLLFAGIIICFHAFQQSKMINLLQEISLSMIIRYDYWEMLNVGFCTDNQLIVYTANSKQLVTPSLHS